jgi:GDPmannose 4,6-dehydratase/GDP-4-dehydro-6-deoxy-D-mannose reductase
MNRKFKRCLITGITGSGGSYLAEHIISKNLKTKVYGFYRSAGYKDILKKKHGAKISLLKVDLNNYKDTYNGLKKTRPDLIFHLASNADVRGSFDEPLLHAKNNTLVTANLLEILRRLNFDPLIVICSTSEVYGNVKKKDMPIKESQKIAPINPYAVSKAYQDMLSQVYCQSFKLKIIITRMFSYTNARRKNLFQTSFATQIARCEKKIQTEIRHGNLNSIRTFVDIDDAMEAYWLTAKKGKIGEIYNICGNKVISVNDFLKELLKLSKSKIRTVLDKNLLRPQDVSLQIASSAKFKKHTGWKTKVSFKNSVKKLLETCRKEM